MQLYSSLTSFILYFLKPYRLWAYAFVVCAIISGLWGTFNSILIKIIIDTLVDDAHNVELVKLLLWPCVLFLVNMQVYDIAWRIIAYINYKIEIKLKSDIINHAFAYVLKQSHQFFQNNFSGKLASDINILASNIEIILNQLSVHVIRGAVLLISALIAMYYVNPMFSLGLLVWSIVFCYLSMAISSKIATYSSNYAEMESKTSGTVVDAISNAQSIKLFANANYEKTYLSKVLLDLQSTFQKKAMFTLKFNLLQGFSLTVLLGYMLYVLVDLKLMNKITVGDFALIIGLTIEVSWTLWWITEQIDHINDAVGRCKQCLSKIFVPYAIIDQPGATQLQVSSGKIVFDKVKFTYKDSAALFQDKSIIIPAGQKVGLVGHSGSGKTTFVNLILRQYDVAAGSIKIDGQDIKDVTQDSLHAAIGMIPQDPVLFHRSLMDNIRYGRVNATDAEVIEAAKRANAHQFIEQLPQAYNTTVGERGIKLSGGQRQRIAIARAFLKNAPILVLDEATSQLDSITENEIQDALWLLMEGKTTLIIAHRLSTILYMDRILVFDKGKIVEDGTHQELLAQGGFYKNLWDAQVGGFISVEEEEDEE